MTDGVRHIIVGTRDFEKSFDLYANQLGLDVRQAPSRVSDAELRLWGMAGTEARAATLAGPNAANGMIRLVSFGAATGAPVRADARPYDYSPKNLDIQCRDIDKAYADLMAAGWQFRSEVVRYEIPGHKVAEVQMRGPDEVNVVLLESDAGEAMTFSPTGYTGATQWVLTVGDLLGTRGFFNDVLGIPEASHNRLDGPGIEKMIGLPPGAGLDIYIMAGNTTHGRIELVHYEGVESAEYTALARPPRSGMLQVGFVVSDVAGIQRSLLDLGATTICDPVECVNAVGETSQAASVAMPSGLMIELWSA